VSDVLAQFIPPTAPRVRYLRAFACGVRDGWRQPHDLCWSTNIEHLAVGDDDLLLVQEWLDVGINYGQVVRSPMHHQRADILSAEEFENLWLQAERTHMADQQEQEPYDEARRLIKQRGTPEQNASTRARIMTLLARAARKERRQP
jgi:hypothetical protein